MWHWPTGPNSFFQWQATIVQFFCTCLCFGFTPVGIGLLSVSIPERESVIHSRTVYFLTFAYIVSVCPFVGFVSGAVSSEARQGGWDERFIWAHRVWEEVERELIRISLSKAITLLLTFHLTFSWTNLPSTGGDRQGETEKVLDLG